MKKQISKPENWQDFESLCKKLWGEIWGIPSKIKKNGRAGQPQNGVDIYGVPKLASKYWGIQCKGKDEYVHAKLSKIEVDEEIRKAKSFNPELEVFIIATTANKDSSIEEYVRIKDLDNRDSGSFEILLFSWEDIADLIEENRSTFEYYVNKNQFKYKYDFQVFVGAFESKLELNPTFFREVKKYKVNEEQHDFLLNIPRLRRNHLFGLPLMDNKNYAICNFKLTMKNTGNVVIENWKVLFEIQGEHKKINDSKYLPHGMINLSYETKKRTIIKENSIKYTSDKDDPLIQDDSRFFELRIIPLPKEYIIPIKWKLNARDYQQEGEFELIIKPKFNDEVEWIFVDNVRDLKENEIISIRENEYKIDEKSDI